MRDRTSGAPCSRWIETKGRAGPICNIDVCVDEDLAWVIETKGRAGPICNDDACSGDVPGHGIETKGRADPICNPISRASSVMSQPFKISSSMVKRLQDVTPQDVDMDRDGARTMYADFLAWLKESFPDDIDPPQPVHEFYEGVRRLAADNIKSECIAPIAAKPKAVMLVDDLVESLLKKKNRLDVRLREAALEKGGRLFIQVDIAARNVWINGEEAYEDKLAKADEIIGRNQELMARCQAEMSETKTFLEQTSEEITRLQKALDDKRIDRRIEQAKLEATIECERRFRKDLALAITERDESRREATELREAKRRLKESVERERAKVAQLEELLK